MTKTKFYYLLLACVCCLGGSCSNDPELKNYNAEVTQQQITRQSKLQFIKSIILDETAYKIGRITPTLTFVSPIGEIYIHDFKNDLYCAYDSLGNFKFLIGKKGKGPGELYRPASLTMDDQQHIYVFDEAKFSTVVYDQSNQFITEVSYDKCFPRSGSLQFTKRDTLITLFCATKENLYDDIELFHQLDSQFRIIRSIAIDYPAIYKKLELGNYQFHEWVADAEAIYVLYRAIHEVYKYNRNGKLLAILPMRQAKHFKTINEKQLKTIDLVKLKRFLSKFSTAGGLYLFKEKILCVLSYNQVIPTVFNNPFGGSREFRTFYYNLVTTDGEEIRPADSKLPGEVLYVTKNSKVYILLNDEPENRKIGVYEIVLEDI